MKLDTPFMWCMQVALLWLLTCQIIQHGHTTCTGIRGTWAFTFQGKLPKRTRTRQHSHMTLLKMSPNNNSGEEEFKLGKPIDLPSLREPQDAGPMFATCRSVSGVESSPASEDEVVEDPKNLKEEVESDAFVPNKPIELDSLRQQEQTTFLGLTPKDDDLRRRDGSLNVAESGLPLFTSTIVFGVTWYLIYVALFTDYVP